IGPGQCPRRCTGTPRPSGSARTRSWALWLLVGRLLHRGRSCCVLGKVSCRCLQTGLGELVGGQIDQQFEAALDQVQGLAEGFELLFVGAIAFRGVGIAPVRGGWVPGPDGADLTGRVVAHRDDQIHLWRLWRGKFIPALAAQPLGGDARLCRTCKPSGLGVWFSRGLLPAEKALKRLSPIEFSKASAKMLRAELWVQRNRTFRGVALVVMVASATSGIKANALGQIVNVHVDMESFHGALLLRYSAVTWVGCRREAGCPLAAVLGEVTQQPVHGFE